MKKPFEPNFKTDSDSFNKVELNKLTFGLKGPVHDELHNFQKGDLIWEAEQIAKSFGIYLEYNRAKTGREKDWMFMLRISNPGGGPINRKQYLLLDELSEKYSRNPEANGQSSLRFTTRQNIQFHWLGKKGVLEIVKTMAENGLRSLNGCGDNTRNVMGCPLSRYSDVFNGHAWAHKCGEYFQLPVEPFIEVFAIDPNYLRKPEQSFKYPPNLMNRKFKLAFLGVHRDHETGELKPENCVEVRTNDMGVAPVIENGKIRAFQIYIGGSQGERNGELSMASLGLPVCITTEDKMLETIEAGVKVHAEWGDREHRHWARVKYLVHAKGADWYRERMGEILGRKLEAPKPDLDIGERELHIGWHRQPANGLWSYGAFIENGRIVDGGPNGNLKTMMREIMQKYPVELMITTNQDVIFTNLPEKSKEDFERDLASYGVGSRFGKKFSKLRVLSGACVGRDTCKLTYTDSEKFEPVLIDELEQMGWGDLAESIGVTGCEAQCYRPATKTIGVIGTGLNRYTFKLFGDAGAHYQGKPLVSADGTKMYLRFVPRERVSHVINSIFKYYKHGTKDGEDLGAYLRRTGAQALIDHLSNDPSVQDLMEKPFHTDWFLDPDNFPKDFTESKGKAKPAAAPAASGNMRKFN